jgi:hypothetical protein
MHEAVGTINLEYYGNDMPTKSNVSQAALVLEVIALEMYTY